MARRASASLIASISAAISTKCNLQNKANRYLISARSAHASPAANDGMNVRKEEVVIVGAGVAGLATAAMLHKLGIKSRVLEQAESPRTGGVSLSLSKNAWDALEAIGVGDRLRSQYYEIKGIVLKTESGKKLCALKIPEDRSQELRTVERRALLQVLSDPLPPNTVRYSSSLASIEKGEAGETLIRLTDGTRLSAEVVIGCDGIRSQVAKWMGFGEPKYAGYCAYRGLSIRSEGQPLKPVVNYTYGKGMRAGYVPMSPTKTYWFVMHNCPDPGPMITDPSQQKPKVRELARNLPSGLLEIIDDTPEDMIFRNLIEDRLLWPGMTPPASRGRVVVAGDAWHPMTPNLGQGACLALEDAVLLSRKIHGAIRSKEGSVEEALESFGRERRPVLFKTGLRSNLVGKFGQLESSLACYVRNEFVLPRLYPVVQKVDPTYFD